MFCTGILSHNGCYYLIPDCFDHVVKFNPVNYEFTLIGSATGTIGNVVDDSDYNSTNGTG